MKQDIFTISGEEKVLNPPALKSKYTKILKDAGSTNNNSIDSNARYGAISPKGYSVVWLFNQGSLLVKTIVPEEKVFIQLTTDDSKFMEKFKKLASISGNGKPRPAPKAKKKSSVKKKK